MKLKQLAVLVLALAAAWSFPARAVEAPTGDEGYSEVLFDFIVFGDTRFANPGEPLPEAFKRILEEAGLIRPDFLIHTGDLVMFYGGDEKAEKAEYDKIDAFITHLEHRGYFMPGNHDYSSQKSIDNFKKLTSQSKDYFSFDYKGAGFIILNTELPGQVGRITGAQREWLGQELEKRKDYPEVFVFLHRPLFAPEQTYRDDNGNWMPQAKFYASEKERMDLVNLFVKYKVSAVFSGHQNLYYRYDYQGIPFITIGGSGASFSAPVEKGGFFHYMIVSVTKKGINFNLMEPFQFSVQVRYYDKEGRAYGEALINNLHGEVKRGTIPLNGIKFTMPKGKYKVRAESVLSTKTMMEAGESVLTISDYGENEGAAEEKLKSVIVRFLKPVIYKEEPNPENPALVDLWVRLEAPGTFPVRLTVSTESAPE
jgi:hypothetical protein